MVMKNVIYSYKITKTYFTAIRNNKTYSIAIRNAKNIF